MGRRLTPGVVFMVAVVVVLSEAVALSLAVTFAPLGGVPVTVAVLVKLPSFTSSWLTA